METTMCLLARYKHQINLFWDFVRITRKTYIVVTRPAQKRGDGWYMYCNALVSDIAVKNTNYLSDSKTNRSILNLDPNIHKEELNMIVSKYY